MQQYPLDSLFRGIACLYLLLVLAACGDDLYRSVLDQPPQETGVLTVVTRSGSTTYYLDRHETGTGPEYDLVMALAASKGWEVHWKVVPTTAEALKVLEAGGAHLAAAGLTHMDSRDELFERGPEVKEITQQVVCHRRMNPMPGRPQDLEKVDLWVTADSSYAEKLQKLSQKYQDLDYNSVEISTERLLGMVAQQDIECTVADSNIVQINQRFMPYLYVAFDLTQTQGLGWYLPKGYEDLAMKAASWMNSPEGQNALHEMQVEYYAHIKDFDFVDLRALNRRIQDRLPRYKEYFLLAEQETGMPADLLAALAYQESHWDPEAVSRTGVRGIMMLTKRTAMYLGVEDRLDPAQSILGGARYLEERYRLLPEDIPDPDRLYLALASYNVGRGHLLDARRLARNLGKDSDSWDDMQQVLPLLSDERYYPSLRYGYARGFEPVHFVSRVRNYRDIIARAF
ncbi:membrane-bound lytic murein transglycosylase MltF [Desulfonatronospira sp.]|uniref:membrane-bound lytic murein transglycosylase MltF n=1 Tax=Desulfonatronospira sp. TaxID=1962951 RepID=UPI0025B8B4FD|nr:membrane-bound lytic murein transglycosylase MltF [Desulfonatronospira sp.]